MNISKILIGFLFFTCIILVSKSGISQITSAANKVVPTEYSSGIQDSIYVFCGKKGDVNASLIARYPQGETGNFEWQKYNTVIGDFDPFPNGVTNAGTSTISNLADGCYRVKISPISGAKTYTAWVFNNYVEVTAEVTASDCKSFTLKGTIVSPITLQYVDLSNGQTKFLSKNIKVEWKDGSTVVYTTSIAYQNFNPPTKNTTYALVLTDRFGCTGNTEVEYFSIVTKASFTYKLEDQGPKSKDTKIEAPATYTFTNTSENGDAGKYEWYFYKDIQQITKEKEAGTFKDSIQDIIYSDNPVYTYENTGEYKVKLISKKVSQNTTCTNTAYIDNNIIVEASFIDAPNVFTPNGDGKNDNFAVMFFSMKSVKISIFNRWGKLLHVWENSNLQGFYNTVDKVPQSVWDGKVGGKIATPGVYFWIAEGVGRDGERRKGNGFFHLFRDK